MTTISFEACKTETVKDTYFSSEQIAFLSTDKIPKHIAIVMDGNRRWAHKMNVPIIMGHSEGAETLIDLVEAASELGIQTITAYSFSTENWGRSKEEIDDVMDVLEQYVHRKREHMVQEGIRFDWIGNLSGMPERVQNAFFLTKQATERNHKINIVLAVNYGGRDEIRRAICNILAMHDQKKLDREDITEGFIAAQLDTARYGDPDLVIRTSGEFRVSNFLLWQISYAEWYLTDVLWPDFSHLHLYEAIAAFQGRKKRKGT